MNNLKFLIKFILRYKNWLIVGPICVALLAALLLRNLHKKYYSFTTIYTGATNGFNLDSEDKSSTDTYNSQNSIENLIQIIQSPSTLESVSLKMFVQAVLYGKNNTKYIDPEGHNRLMSIIPEEVLYLLDSTSIEKSVNNLKKYMTNDRDNFVYGLLNYKHPYFSFEALDDISVKRMGSSDMIEISYTSNDPGIAYQTLLLLTNEFADRYRDLRFSETNKVVDYFRTELAKAEIALRNAEERLMLFNKENLIINYPEQTKYIASQNEKYEVAYEEILLRNKSSDAAILDLEEKMGLSAKNFAQSDIMIAKRNELAKVQTNIATLQTLLPKEQQETNESLKQYQEKEKQIRTELDQTISNILSYQNTPEGVDMVNVVNQWLEEVMRNTKSKAELKVMELRRSQLDSTYSRMSPIGATLGQMEREVHLAEQNYLSLRRGLEAAILKQKNLELTSASLKIVNPPLFPINAQSKRKVIFIMAVFAAFIFLFVVLLAVEFMDTTLRDKRRTEKLTGKKVLSGLPLVRPGISPRINEAAVRRLTNTVSEYLRNQQISCINVLSLNSQEGKTYMTELLAAELNKTGYQTQVLNYEKDFDLQKHAYLISENPEKEIMEDHLKTQPEVCIIEYPASKSSAYPNQLLKHDVLNIVVCRANRGWQDADELELERLSIQANNRLVIVLNAMSKFDIIEFIGTEVGKNKLQRFYYRLLNQEFTAKNKLA